MDATAEHCQWVAAHARPEDVDELWAAGRTTPSQCLSLGLASGLLVHAGLVDGEPVCVFGVTPASLLSGVGCPWMVATPGVERVARRFAVLSRPVVDRMNAIFPMLVNFVDNRNVKAMRWLAWLGFEFGDQVQHGPDGRPFSPFWRRRHV